VSLTRRERPSLLTSWTLVAAVVLAIPSAAVGTTLGTTLYEVPVALSFALAVLHAAAIPLALPKPEFAAVVTAALVTAQATVQSAAGVTPWPWAVNTIVTHSIVIALIGLQARSRVGLAAWAAAAVGTVAVAFLYPRDSDAAAINIIIAISVSGVALGLGVVARQWRSIRSQLLRERAVSAEEHARRVLAEEKTRISRELHDVVAHSMSIINVQASSAVYRHNDVPPAVAQEFDEIATAARTAISELRGMLSVLRDDGMPQQLAPQPTLADIPELVHNAERSGVDVTLRWSDPATDAVTAATGLAAYRIVQEAMSNAIRHSPGAAIVVECSLEADALLISITNAAGRVAPSGARIEAPFPPLDPGHGITGMRERATAVGGILDIGPTPGGGYAVHARLPLAGAA
jgi:signal transduction histidine kinase